MFIYWFMIMCVHFMKSPSWHRCEILTWSTHEPQCIILARNLSIVYLYHASFMLLRRHKSENKMCIMWFYERRHRRNRNIVRNSWKSTLIDLLNWKCQYFWEWYIILMIILLLNNVNLALLLTNYSHCLDDNGKFFANSWKIYLSVYLRTLGTLLELPNNRILILNQDFHVNLHVIPMIMQKTESWAF